MLTNLFLSLGWTRDSAHWAWLKLLTVATLIASNAIDLSYWATYLGLHLTPTALHWISAIAVVLLWIAGSNDSSPLPGKKTLGVVLGVILLGLGTVACGSARHVATKADQGFVLAIGAVDDGQYALCHGQVLLAPKAQCDQLDVVIKRALLDAKTVTAAIQATPKDAKVPKDLPSLLSDLREVQTVAASLPPSDVTTALGGKVGKALDAVIALLTQIAGS